MFLTNLILSFTLGSIYVKQVLCFCIGWLGYAWKLIYPKIYLYPYGIPLAITCIIYSLFVLYLVYNYFYTLILANIEDFIIDIPLTIEYFQFLLKYTSNTIFLVLNKFYEFYYIWNRWQYLVFINSRFMKFYWILIAIIIYW